MFKKKRLKGFLAMGLAALQVIGLAAGSGVLPAVAAEETVTIYDMMVNDLDDPIGIDDGVPAFSWKLESGTMGQKQTAYQLKVATDAALTDTVWDSGKVESSDTTDIPYGGEALADCTRYYWQVTVWDKDSVAFTSETHLFETAFLNGSLLDGATWIEVDETVSTDNTESTVDYAIDMDVVSITGSFGLLFGAAYKQNGDYFMWQVKDKGTYYQIAPLYYINNKWTAHSTTADVTDVAYSDMQDGFHLTVRVNDYCIATYVDNVLVSVVTCAELGYTPSLGFVGLREATSEGVVLDNVTVTDYLNNADGVTLVNWDFSEKPSVMTNTNSVVANGVLTADSPSTVSNWYGEDTLASGLTAAKKRTRDFAVDMDIISIKSALGLLFGAGNRVNGDCFMWKIEDKTTSYQLTPVCFVNNKWTVLGSTTTISAVSYADMADGFHLSVRITDDSITTYVDGTLVATYTCASLGYTPSLGYVGLREATDEGVVLDNLTVTDYFNNPSGVVLSKLTYDSETDGTLHAVSDAAVNNNWYGEVTQMSGLTVAAEKTVDYTVEMDVLSITDTLGVLFGSGKETDGKAFMWQVKDKGTYYLVSAQYYDAAYKWKWQAATSGETSLSADTYASMADGFHLKLHITDNKVETYIDGVLVSTVTSSQINGYTLSLGHVGIRGSSAEKASVDNVKVVDYLENSEGEVLANLDFNEKPSAMTNANTVIENGVFSMNPDVSFGIDYFVEGLGSAEKETVVLPTIKDIRYTVTADIACSSLAASLCFNAKDTSNFLMWQFGMTDTTVELRPHQWLNGACTVFDTVDITQHVTPVALQAGVALQITVVDNAILTRINGVLVDTFDASQLSLELFPGKAGVRVATDEAFTLDNFKMVDRFETENDGVKFDIDFETANPLYRGTLTDGKLSLSYADKDNGITFVHTGTSTFRKEFTAEKDIADARLYITSYGTFTAYLNGEKVGNKNAAGETVYDELAPGWTDQNYRTCYYTYDVTDFLADGDNTLAVGVNYGWTGISLYYSDEPKTPHKLLAKVVITYTDGSTKVVGTDNTWDTAIVGPVMAGDIFQGEYYDATVDTSYRLNGYDTAKWNKGKEVTFNTTLAARIGGQIYVRKDLERTPKTVTVYDGVTDAVDGTQYGKINVTATYGDEAFTLKAGETAVVDLGQNASGWENITVEGAAGTHVVIRHAEMLNDNMGLISRGNDGPEGSVYTANLRKSPARTVYVMTDGVQTYRPTVTYYGFRYMEITATADITIHKIRGEVATSVLETDGSFESSDALLNQLYSNTVWGQYSNHFGQATDCPQRDERLGYPGDFMVFSQSAVYNADVKAFIYNFMDTLVEGQAENGGFGMVMPKKYASSDLYIGIAGSADGGIVIPYTYYRQYGDKAFLERYYDAMAAYMDYLAAAGAERPNQKYGDWLSYEGYIENYISYVYTVWDAQMMQEIAAALGKTDDVQKWAAMEETHKGYFREKFLDENGDLTVTTQSAYLFALKLGLYETEEAYARGKEALVAKIKNNGNKLSTGFQGTFILMDTLVQIGEVDLAYELLFQDENPSWLFSVKQGATTAWERWNSYSKEDGFGPVSMNSFNHYAFGSVSAYLYKTVLGIMPETEGYTSVLLQPVPTDKLTYARGSYDSVNGNIQSAWELDANGKYQYTFTVPANTTATVKLETQAYGDYVVNGVAADALTLETHGVQYIGEQDGKAVFETTSGTFTFTCEAAPPLVADKGAGAETFTFSVAGLKDYDGGYVDNEGKNWYQLTADDNDAVETLENKFHFYYNREGAVYTQRDLFDNTDTTDSYGGNSDTAKGYSYWNLLYNHFLQRATGKTSGEIFRKIDSLVPLSVTGEEVYTKNFETTFDVRFESETVGAVILGFRQQVAGKFTTAYYELVKEHGFVAIGRSGITIAAGDDIVATKNGTAENDMYNHFETTFTEMLPQEVTVKVRVVGTTCQVEICKRGESTPLYTFEQEVPYEKWGTLAYAVSATNHDIGNISLVALDDDGNQQDIGVNLTPVDGELVYKGGTVWADAEKTDSGYRYTLTVQPKEGYELKAGSLYVETADGYCIPQRVGFREGGNADAYTFVSTNGGTVYAQFIKPTADNPNIGNVGTSVNEELAGVRFVSRFTRVVEDGVEYVVLDGEKYAVSDYGMLLGLAAVVGDNDLTVELAAESTYIQQLSVKGSGIYYDVCDDYNEMSVCITGVDMVSGGADMDITARAYVVVTIDGVETTLYAATFTANYNDHI